MRLDSKTGRSALHAMRLPCCSKQGVIVPVFLVAGDPPATSAPAPQEQKLTLAQKAKALAGALPPAYWQALSVVGLLYFARFDASFITLRAKTVRPFFISIGGDMV